MKDSAAVLLIGFALMMSMALCRPMKSSAQIIDFETTPAGATPVDNTTLGLNDAYSVGNVDVTFGFDKSTPAGIADTEAVFEQSGPSDTTFGFQGSEGDDTADPGFGSQLGTFFLRPPDFTDFGVFIIQYSSETELVTAAAGEIWDLDGNGASQSEEFTLTLYDLNGNPTVLPSPEQTTEEPLDGQPWEFGFTGIVEGIDRIEIDFTGTKTTNIGLVFNNFDATGVTVGPKKVTTMSHVMRITTIAALVMSGIVAIRLRQRRLVVA
jgi:hypothetical protein